MGGEEKRVRRREKGREVGGREVYRRESRLFQLAGLASLESPHPKFQSTID